MSQINHIKPLQEALAATAEQLRAAVQAKEDLGRELDRERSERGREEAVLLAARRLKTAFLAYEDRRVLLDGIQIQDSEKSLALQPYWSATLKAQRELFLALERMDASESATGERKKAVGG